MERDAGLCVTAGAAGSGGGAGGGPHGVAEGVSAASSSLRARVRQVLTVPTGRSRISAMSSYARPSISRRMKHSR